MSKYITLLSILILSINVSFSQVGKEISVLLQSTVQESPAEITLKWKIHSTSTGYSVFRKLKNGTSWGSSIASLSATDSMYTDTSVSVGISYEYKVEKSGTRKGYGYVNTGIKVSSDHLENKGKFIIVVDTTYLNDFYQELWQLEQDIRLDGWQVFVIKADRTETDVAVKNRIKSLYNSDPTNFKAVLLLGHVPVPYSGDFAYDGHSNHQGAWPADMYYGEMNGTWTDVTVNNTTPSRAANDNIPGDGKWDHTSIPSDIELQVGRIDFHSLPAFTKTEGQLIKQYLIKDHNYKIKAFNTVNKALVDDNFKTVAEGFSASGYRNFSPIVGIDSIFDVDYFTTLRKSPYIWSYGCGGGSYTSANGIGNTNGFSTDSLRSIFTMLFGSYFGDFDANNNFSRSALASGNTLTTAWAGRPHWVFHHMGQGENIGYNVKLTQNNSTLYHASTLSGFYRVIVANFLGDISLRQHVIAPPSNVQLNTSGPFITWTASPETVLGYNVYKADSLNGVYTKLNSSIITGTSFSYVGSGNDYYMVRAVKLEETASGSYYNLSLGAIGSYSPVGLPESKKLEFGLYPNPATSFVTISTDEKIENISVLSLDGKTLINNSNPVSNRIDILNLTSGVYVVAIKSNNNIHGYKRLVIK